MYADSYGDIGGQELCTEISFLCFLWGQVHLVGKLHTVIWCWCIFTRVSERYSDTTNNWTLIHGEISNADNWLYYGNEGCAYWIWQLKNGVWASIPFDSWVLESGTPCFLELGPHKSRKNNCNLRTMQRIQTGLVALRCWQPAHSNDINIVGLICSLRCPQRKTTKIFYPIIEGATHSTFSDTLQHLRQLRQQISGMQQ